MQISHHKVSSLVSITTPLCVDHTVVGAVFCWPLTEDPLHDCNLLGGFDPIFPLQV